jgi:hypothetical protein
MKIGRRTLIGTDGTLLGVGEKIAAPEALGRISNETRRIYDLWVHARQPDGLPSLAQFPLHEIADLLPSILIVDVLEAQHDYLYRQCGALEMQVRGDNPIGKTVRQCHEGEVLDFVLESYDRVVASGDALIDFSVDINRDPRFVGTEALLLPFSEVGVAVTQVLGYVHYVEISGNATPSG